MCGLCRGIGRGGLFGVGLGGWSCLLFWLCLCWCLGIEGWEKGCLLIDGGCCPVLAEVLVSLERKTGGLRRRGWKVWYVYGFTEGLMSLLTAAGSQPSARPLVGIDPMPFRCEATESGRWSPSSYMRCRTPHPARRLPGVCTLGAGPDCRPVTTTCLVSRKILKM